MFDTGAVATMPPKKRSVGRPKAPKPLRSLISLKGTDDFEAWVDGFVKFARQGTRTLLLRNALYELAKSKGYEPEMPER